MIGLLVIWRSALIEEKFGLCTLLLPLSLSSSVWCRRSCCGGFRHQPNSRYSLIATTIASHVDVFLCETMSTAQEARAAASAAHAADQHKPVRAFICVRLVVACVPQRLCVFTHVFVVLKVMRHKVVFLRRCRDCCCRLTLASSSLCLFGQIWVSWTLNEAEPTLRSGETIDDVRRVSLSLHDASLCNVDFVGLW